MSSTNPLLFLFDGCLVVEVAKLFVVVVVVYKTKETAIVRQQSKTKSSDSGNLYLFSSNS